MSKMLFVKSNDYWGYDASQFDDAVNFYRFTWVVPEAMYKTLDSDDQNSLNPCALFYVQGVTDNHNFLTLKIAQDGDEAKVSGMQGTKRRTRRYNIGSPAQYSVGSYALQEAPAGATSVEAIKEAVESGSTSEGSFNVSEFLTEAADIAAAVNMVTEDKSAETFAAPAEVPSGSAYEPADPTVFDPATEGYSESDLVTMDEFSAMEYTPEIGGYPGLPVIPDSYGENSAGEGFGVPVWYGSAEEGDSEHRVFYTVIDKNTGEEVDEGQVVVSASSMEEALNEALRMLEEGGLEDEYYEVYPNGMRMMAEGDSRLRDIRGKFMNRRKAKDAVFGEVMSQQMSGYYRTGIVGDNPPVGQNIARRNPVAKARYFIEPGVQNPNSGEWSKGPNFQQARKIAKGVAWDTVQDMGLAAETAELQMTTLGDQEFPVVPDSYGESSAVVSGRGVPQWYGSAEQGYNDKMDESLGMRHRGSHKQSMKDRRDEASAMDKMHSKMGRKYDDVMTMDAQGYNDKMDESLGMRHRGKHSQSMKDRRDEASAMDKMHTRMGRKYDDVSTMDAQSITETLEEAAPVSLKKPVLVAAISALTGFLIARRKA